MHPWIIRYLAQTMSNKVAPQDAQRQREWGASTECSTRGLTRFRAAGRIVSHINALGAGQVATQNKMGRFVLEEEADMALVALVLQLGLGAASPSDSAAHYQVRSMRLDMPVHVCQCVHVWRICRHSSRGYAGRCSRAPHF